MGDDVAVVTTHVFILIPSLSPAGPIKGAIALANGLAGGTPVSLVVLKHGPGADAAIKDAVEVISLADLPHFPAKIKAYRRMLKSCPNPAFSVSMCFSADMLNLFAKNLAVTLASVRGNLSQNYSMDYGTKGRILAQVHLRAVRFLDHVTSMTQSMAEEMRATAGCESKVISNFIDETALAEVRSSPPGESEALGFVFLGSLSHRKQPHLILEAAARLQNEGHDIKLDFLGDGPLRQQLEARAVSLGLGDIVEFHGQVADPFNLVRRADALVLPSLSEGISRAAMEALYLGTPCAMRQIDGNRELIEDGVNGYLFERDDELGQAMLKAARLGRENRDNSDILLPDSFRQERAVAAYLALFSGDMPEQGQDYFDYLRTRSKLGDLYRRFWLYPRLARLLTGKALDVGCGIGDFLRFRNNTVGVDINPRTVDWCRGQGMDAQLFDGTSLPFEDHSFDSAIMDNVLEHIEEPAQLLAEVRRVLKPNAPFVVGVPGSKGFASDPDHKVPYDTSRLNETLGVAGFAQIRRFYMPLPGTMLDEKIKQHCLYGVFRNLEK